MESKGSPALALASISLVIPFNTNYYGNKLRSSHGPNVHFEWLNRGTKPYRKSADRILIPGSNHHVDPLP